VTFGDYFTLPREDRPPRHVELHRIRAGLRRFPRVPVFTRMWGEAAFEIASHRGDYLRISFAGSTHCSLR
jgi:hypothetical protein